MTYRDNITLPREVVEGALEAFEAVRPFSTTQRELKIRAVEALRTALAAEQPKHPGYIIGSHWLETAYSRICAGEAEADVLRDCGWERVDDIEALRRDAERYRWLRERAWFQDEFEGRYGDSGETVHELDAAIDAAMEASTAPASAAADASTAPEDKT